MRAGLISCVKNFMKIQSRSYSAEQWTFLWNFMNDVVHLNTTRFQSGKSDCKVFE